MYGVGEFAPEARELSEDIHMLVGNSQFSLGGTGLFIDAVIGNFTIPEVVSRLGISWRAGSFSSKEGNEALWEKLNAVDPDYAADLDPRNYRYVIRGLEIWKATGKSKKVLGQKTESPYDFLRITPYDGDREKLYEKINQRVGEMFRVGLIEEVSKCFLKIQNDTAPSSSGNWQNSVANRGSRWNYAERANILQGNDNWPGFQSQMSLLRNEHLCPESKNFLDWML
jgi:tRNA A37 N6-isopentenylltransferase MiaA